MGKPFYLTTAIDYANGAPHLGHAYEKVLADTIARFHRMNGEDVHYLTGLDEHGQKVQQTAQKRGVSPQQCCDEVAELFQALCTELNISNDDYIRTTQPRHIRVVQELLQKLYDAGEIYKADYKGFYSIRQEQFVLEKDRLENGKWPELFGEVIEITESNYFFRLAKYQDWLRKYLEENPDFIFPDFRRKNVVEFLKEPISDLCISRPKERLSWGIELPFDKDFVTYVWFDALTNYYSASLEKGCWPADVHVIGKDILVPPHAVYWPIMLHAAGIELPKKIVAHGWWLSAGRKVSKTKTDADADAPAEKTALELAKEFGPDAFRYFVMREMAVGQDSEYSETLYMSRYKSDLGNDLGNLVNRVLNMTGNYCGSVSPAATVDEEPERELRELWEKTERQYHGLAAQLDYRNALDALWAFIRGINRYADTRAPWKLAKSEAAEDRAKLETSLAVMSEGLRLAAVALTPVMPGISAKIQELLGCVPAKLFDGYQTWGSSLVGKTFGAKAILFPRPEKK
ncbi:MAG: methionine--tRNA ligase [Verrucomicrobia bacterium]|nr:methionine--tRNA ligase [Verrucomicrobiota bacterium]